MPLGGGGGDVATHTSSPEFGMTVYMVSLAGAIDALALADGAGVEDGCEGNVSSACCCCVPQHATNARDVQRITNGGARA